jgi:hypothetical protein
MNVFRSAFNIAVNSVSIFRKVEDANCSRRFIFVRRFISDFLFYESPERCVDGRIELSALILA